MWNLLAISCVILMSLAVCHGKILQLEARRTKGDHSIHTRDNAIAGSSVMLIGGKSISLSFCLRQEITSIRVEDVLFSNDGDADRCFVTIDGRNVGSFTSFAESDHGRLWNVFRNSGKVGKGVQLDEGIHYLRVSCDSVDRIEIDVIKIDATNNLLTPDTFGCRLQCQSLSSLKRPVKPGLFSQNASVSQRSYPTKCAEEDNVHIPIYMPDIANYTITATLPTYTSYINRRDPDEQNCHFLPPVHWRFKDFRLSASKKPLRSEGSKLHFVKGEHNMRNSKGVKVDFDLEGPSKGHLDSEIGSFMVLRVRPAIFSFLVSVAYVGRHGYRTNMERKFLLPGQRELVWKFPDFTWAERKRNSVIVKFSAVFTLDLHIEELRMERRYMKPERPFSIYKSDDIIIEGVDVDFTWREPEKMTARRLDNGQTWDDVDYFRILRSVPWAEGYAQVFVLYQDGNARLLQLPPSGLDWIPFGSSVIIGPTDPNFFRPAAPIAKVEFAPQDLTMNLIFRDGGSSKLHLKSEIDQTVLTVTNIRFKQTSFVPFATFRSMYVEDGNSDCDRVMVDGEDVYNILDPWSARKGRSFSFFRQCESKHLTLSPDITVDVTGVYD